MKIYCPQCYYHFYLEPKKIQMSQEARVDFSGWKYHHHYECPSCKQTMDLNNMKQKIEEVLTVGELVFDSGLYTKAQFIKTILDNVKDDESVSIERFGYDGGIDFIIKKVVAREETDYEEAARMLKESKAMKALEKKVTKEKAELARLKVKYE
jgi:hypothetical protein